MRGVEAGVTDIARKAHEAFYYARFFFYKYHRIQ